MLRNPGTAGPRARRGRPPWLRTAWWGIDRYTTAVYNADLTWPTRRGTQTLRRPGNTLARTRGQNMRTHRNAHG
eukprot:3932856-Lingulodinium_polyedra.AAC.1